ncbi:helix-turn-helix domain-containing protein [Kaistella anthropi]|nr:helix-turn-helix domain-containing protein [Kaistella anthropi]
MVNFSVFSTLHFKNEKELKFYADKLYITVKYLSNTVREITKVPPTYFITDSIINEAKINLLDNNTSIKEIANQLGFADQYTFGKFFKKHTGLSPKHYRLENTLIQSF